jgi:hypothetical protein
MLELWQRGDAARPARPWSLLGLSSAVPTPAPPLLFPHTLLPTPCFPPSQDQLALEEGARAAASLAAASSASSSPEPQDEPITSISDPEDSAVTSRARSGPAASCSPSERAAPPRAAQLEQGAKRNGSAVAAARARQLAAVAAGVGSWRPQAGRSVPQAGPHQSPRATSAPQQEAVAPLVPSASGRPAARPFASPAAAEAAEAAAAAAAPPLALQQQQEARSVSKTRLVCRTSRLSYKAWAGKIAI